MLPQRVLVVGQGDQPRLMQTACFEDWLLQPTLAKDYKFIHIVDAPPTKRTRLGATTVTNHNQSSTVTVISTELFNDLKNALAKHEAVFKCQIAPLKYRFEIQTTTCAYGQTHRSNHSWWHIDLWRRRISYYCYDDDCITKYSKTLPDGRRVVEPSKVRIDPLSVISPELHRRCAAFC